MTGHRDSEFEISGSFFEKHVTHSFVSQSVAWLPRCSGCQGNAGVEPRTAGEH